RGKITPTERPSTSNQRRPQPAMHLRDLTRHKTADQHLGRVAHGARKPEDLLSLLVTPPTPPNRRSHHGLRQVGHRSPRAFEYDTVSPHEGKGSPRSHAGKFTETVRGAA